MTNEEFHEYVNDYHKVAAAEREMERQAPIKIPQATGIQLLLGKTLKTVTDICDELNFETVDGEKFRMWHRQDCCEHVTIEDIAGDLQSLLGSPILQAEKSINREGEKPTGADDSFTWTFYLLATINGYITIRWFGTSNGYYSESVDFEKVES